MLMLEEGGADHRVGADDHWLVNLCVDSVYAGDLFVHLTHQLVLLIVGRIIDSLPAVRLGVLLPIPRQVCRMIIELLPAMTLGTGHALTAPAHIGRFQSLLSVPAQTSLGFVAINFWRPAKILHVMRIHTYLAIVAESPIAYSLV